MTIDTSADEIGIIGEYEEYGLPVVVSFENELPEAEFRKRRSWLTVVSWTYDGSLRNGMPPAPVNDELIRLENALLDSVVSPDSCFHAYNRTGNNRKEFVFYIVDQESFLKHLNEALADHPQYPIEIKFYDDPTWEDFQELMELFREKK